LHGLTDSKSLGLPGLTAGAEIVGTTESTGTKLSDETKSSGLHGLTDSKSLGLPGLTAGAEILGTTESTGTKLSDETKSSGLNGHTDSKSLGLPGLTARAEILGTTESTGAKLSDEIRTEFLDTTGSASTTISEETKSKISKSAGLPKITGKAASLETTKSLGRTKPLDLHEAMDTIFSDKAESSNQIGPYKDCKINSERLGGDRDFKPKEFSDGELALEDGVQLDQGSPEPMYLAFTISNAGKFKGKGTEKLIVFEHDSGADRTIISKRTATNLGLELRTFPKTKTIKGVGGAISCGQYSIVRLRTEDMELKVLI
jgi:hypothetical protein